ncbi:MAG: PaaI family thioesterase [Chloroflexi bacterium]|nr:PaaI family thioesterase [Chloroflexota bacterium]
MAVDRHHHHHIEGIRQPNAQMCFVCGVANVAGLRIRFYTTGEDVVEAIVSLPDEYQGYPGIAHGGIIATILDETMGRAAISPEDPNRLLFTGKMEVRYRNSVPLNTPIHFRGWITKDRGRVVVAQGEAVLPDGTVAVETTGTMMAIPQSQLDEMNTPEVGWRVYEDHEYPDL